MSRISRIHLLVVMAVVTLGLQLQAQGYLHHDPPAQEMVLPPEAGQKHRVVLFVPESSTVGAPENTVTISNLTDKAIELDIKPSDSLGLKLDVSHEVIEPLGVLELPEALLPAGSRLT